MWFLLIALTPCLILLALTLLPSGPSVRRGRFGDVLETVSLLALLPLLVLAIGLSDALPV